jgi:hypothetical protein
MNRTALQLLINFPRPANAARTKRFKPDCMVFGELLKIDFMIIGKLKEAGAPEYDEEQLRDEYYSYALQGFEGGTGSQYGIVDELYDLGKWIEVIGETVVKEEKEFQEIEKHDPDLEFGFPSQNLLDAWHKKMFRPFSYKQLMMGIHTSFNDAMVSFYELLVSEGRIADTVHIGNRNVLDILKELKGLDPTLPDLLDQVRGFNFIRNRVTHNDGFYHEKIKDITSFNNIIKGRTDIQTEQLRSLRGEYTHRMKILRSTIMTDYIGVIRKVFDGLLKGASNLKYIVPAATSAATTEK